MFQIIIFLNIFSIWFPLFCYGQEESFYIMEPLVVTASRIPATFLGTDRNIKVIEKEEIENSPASGVADLLKFVSGVYINERGSEGIQSDVGVAGGTFEQTLILLDGVEVNNPQTAHHDLNLPIGLEDIERIEILKGPGTRLYGAGAFAGVVNIITKKAENRDLKIKALIGDYELFDGSFSFSQPVGITYNYVSVSGKTSEGYRHNTDFDIWNVFFKSSLNYRKLKGDISFGYNDKEFGASRFYSDMYLNEREHTKTTFLKGSLGFRKNNMCFYWKRHSDDYVLDYEDPDFYRNFHTTYKYGLEINSSVSSAVGSTAGGLELGQEKINSERLGNHSRDKSRFFFEHKIPALKNVTVTFGSSLFYYSDWDWYFYPGMDIGLKINNRNYLYASIESGFRVPSYTELYLVSPANEGDPSLTPERVLSFEAGVKMVRGSILANANIFIRNEKNVIDWVRQDENESWTARNMGEVTVKGLDLNITFKSIARMYKKIPIPSINLGYTFLNLSREENSLQSKYLLGKPEHKFTLNADYDLISNLKQIWKARYEILPDSGKRLILDTGISLEIKNAEFFINITNLLNTNYTELEWIPMPGRWAKAGIRLDI